MKINKKAKHNNNLILSIGLTLISIVGFSQEIFVSIDGDDYASGSISTPLASIEKALKVVVHEKREKEPITIYLREGIYPIQKSINLNKNHSNISIKAYHGEKVSFFGGVSIPVTQIQKEELPATEFVNKREVYKVDRSVSIDWSTNQRIKIQCQKCRKRSCS